MLDGMRFFHVILSEGVSRSRRIFTEQLLSSFLHAAALEMTP